MDKMKKQVEWDFSKLQESLEKYYDTPERLLLEAYKGLTFFVMNLDDEIDMIDLKKNISPIDMILVDIYEAMKDKEMKELKSRLFEKIDIKETIEYETNL